MIVRIMWVNDRQNLPPQVVDRSLEFTTNSPIGNKIPKLRSQIPHCDQHPRNCGHNFRTCDENPRIEITISRLSSKSQDWDPNSPIGNKIPKLRSQIPHCDQHPGIAITIRRWWPKTYSAASEPKKLRNILKACQVLVVSGVIPVGRN